MREALSAIFSLLQDSKYQQSLNLFYPTFDLLAAPQGALIHYHTNNSINVRITPATVKAIPFLKMLVPGINIQKVEITKNNRETPKKTFRKKSGSDDLALCSPVSLLIT
jgi:hypothetical protein